MQEDNLFIIAAVGTDTPGLVHNLSNILAQNNINIVDVEARSVRGHFTMFMVIDTLASHLDQTALQTILKDANQKFNVSFSITPYTLSNRIIQKDLMVLTIMGADAPGIIAKVTQIFTQNNINIEKMKMIARGETIAMELRIDTSNINSLADFRQIIRGFSDQTNLDTSLRAYNSFKRPDRVVIFDCDSTVIQAEVIDELAKIAGVGEQVETITHQAMCGEIDFETALRKRVALLKGLTVEQLDALTATIALTPGAEELIQTLHAMGYRVGVVSGGFMFFMEYLKKRLNLDYIFANKLEIIDGIVTGKILGNIVDAEKKGALIQEIATQEHISTDQIVAVGDGANDRFMLQNAGLGIGFSPKEILKQHSDGIITTPSLKGLQYFLGIPDED